MANYRVSTNIGNNSSKTTQGKTNKKKTKTDQLRLLTLKHELLKICVYLQTAFAAETRLAGWQWLKEQLNVVKLRIIRVETRMSTVSRTGGYI
jgi:hypothetical protein